MLNVKYQTLQLCDDQIVVIVLITFVDRIDSLKNMDDTSRYREFYDLKKQQQQFIGLSIQLINKALLCDTYGFNQIVK